MIVKQTPPDEERRLSILNALGLTLASKLSEAKAAKAQSGIESDWTGDEEFYQGFDNANRHEFGHIPQKPLEGGGSSDTGAKPTGSTVFPNITQPYVDASAARVGDMLLPTGDRNFAIDATPIPEMLEGDMQSGQMVRMPDGHVSSMEEALKAFEKMKAKASRKAEKAQTRIDDWLTESHSHAETRKMIDDCAKLGSGVMKGPVPIKVRTRRWRTDKETGVASLVMVEEIKPGSFRIDPWNLFPDPACGESIHNGGYIFERDYLTPKKLEDLKGLPGYIDSQIDLCIEEGPKNAGASQGASAALANKGQFEIYYYHGQATAEELTAAGCQCDGQKKSYPVKFTMVNDRVILAAMNALDSGDFPYDVVPWKRRPNMPWGMGVARQARTPQRIVVAATRNLMDNAGAASGPMHVFRRGIDPQNGVWEVRPHKIWKEGDDSDGQAGAPYTSIIIPMLQVELMNIIQMGMKMAEDVTGLPMLLQGQQGAAPDTVGGMQILNNNGNSVLRRIARIFDSYTESHIRRYYAWLMEYGEDDDEKGDFQIVARGSSALVERDIQNQEMINVLQLCKDPIYKKNPAKAMDEYLKSRRFDPAAFDYTEEELKQMQEQAPPEDPRITAAKIMAESRVQVEQLQAQQAADHATAEARMEMQRQTFEDAQNQLDRQMSEAELSSEERRDLEKQKVLLASLAAKLNTQRDLSMASHTVDVHKHHNPAPQVVAPAVEPAGRAKAGEAYSA